MLNKVQLIGRLGRDLELRFTRGGTAVANGTVATTRFWKDGDGERREEVEWHQVVFWGRAATAAHDILAKGRLVFIEGRLRTRSWEVEDGKRYRTEILVESWQVLDRRPIDAEAEPEADTDPSFDQRTDPDTDIAAEDDREAAVAA